MGDRFWKLLASMCWYFLFSGVWVCSHRNFVVWVLHSHFGCGLGPPTVACGFEAVSRRFDNQFCQRETSTFPDNVLRHSERQE